MNTVVLCLLTEYFGWFFGGSYLFDVADGGRIGL
jgi:hypothetical protein